MGATIQRQISKDIATGVLITSLIFVTPIFMPFLIFLWVLLMPLPILFYRAKLGRTNGAIVPAMSLMVITVITGGISIDMLFVAELMLTGFILGELIEMNFSVEKTVLYACCAVLLTGTVSLVFYGNVAGPGISALISENVTKFFGELKTALNRGDLGISEEQTHLAFNILENTRRLMILMIPYLPSLTISFTILIVWITLIIAKPILTKRGLFYPDFGQLNMWKVPEFLVWCVIGCGAALLLPNQTLKVFAGNGLFILMTIYFLGGIAIVSFYFEKKQFPPMLRFFVYTLIALHHLVLLIVILLGFFDMWVNFRRLKNENGEL